MEQSETDEAIAIGWIDWAKRTNPETGDLRERADKNRARAADDDWASMRLIHIGFDDPGRALRIAIDICHRSDDEWVLCLVGCGPFEDALVGMGRLALDILQIGAAKNDDIWYALEHTWQNLMPDDIWLELQRLLGREQS